MSESLIPRLGAVLGHVGELEQLAEAGAAPPGHDLLDVLRDRGPVQFAAARRRGEVGGRIAGGVHVAPQRRPHLAVVLGRLRVRVWLPVEVVEGLRPGLLGGEKVDERKPEPLMSRRISRCPVSMNSPPRSLSWSLTKPPRRVQQRPPRRLEASWTSAA